jgi:hypothetical protein
MWRIHCAAMRHCRESAGRCSLTALLEFGRVIATDQYTVTIIYYHSGRSIGVADRQDHLNLI